MMPPGPQEHLHLCFSHSPLEPKARVRGRGRFKATPPELEPDREPGPGGGLWTQRSSRGWTVSAELEGEKQFFHGMLRGAAWLLQS